MNRSILSTALLVALLGTVALSGCKKDKPAEPAAPAPTATPAPAPMPPAPAAATASVSAIDLGNTIGADMKVGTPATTFAPKDTIHVSIGTATSDPAAAVPSKLGVKWTHVDSNTVVNDESRDVTLSGAGNTEFHISKPDGFPTGKYKVEVSLDGAVVQSREFEVK